jgi:RNA polymerase-associated protein
MVLFHNVIGHRSQKVRIVLAEKGIACDLEPIESSSIPTEIMEVNPSGSLPLLIDRDLSLYHSGLIVEYLDERFPHPPLLPVYPVARAQTRLILNRLEKDWAVNLDVLESHSATKSQKLKSKKILETNVLNSLSLFDDQPFFRSEEFTVLDSVIIPILFRLSFYGIKLPNSKAANSINQYMERMFNLESFIASKTEEEIEQLV